LAGPIGWERTPTRGATQCGEDVRANPDAVIESVVAQIAPFAAMVDDPERVEAAVSQATAEVDAILASHQQLSEFRGKPILKAVYRHLFASGTKSYSEFVHAVAARVAKDDATLATLNGVFDTLERSVGAVAEATHH